MFLNNKKILITLFIIMKHFKKVQMEQQKVKYLNYIIAI